MKPDMGHGLPSVSEPHLVSGRHAAGEHTPGPWTLVQAQRNSDETTFRAPDKDDFAIVAANLVCPGIVWGGLGSECEANARLIAAAPELLEALELLVGIQDGDSIGMLFSDRLKKARAAIAKARGAATMTGGTKQSFESQP